MKNKLFFVLALLFAVNTWQCVRTDTPKPPTVEPVDSTAQNFSPPLWFCSTDEYQPKTNERQVVVPRTWRVGQTINIGFENGTPQQIARVKALIPEWQANLNYTYDPTKPYNVRIGFRVGWGSFSSLGTSCDAVMRQSQNNITTNFGWLRADGTGADDAIRHEWGHVLSFGHEHLHPNRCPGSVVDTALIIRETMASQGWSEAQVRYNMIDAYTSVNSQLFTYDRTSNMHYPWPGRYCKGGGQDIPSNRFLSPNDIASAKRIYPGVIDPPIVTGITITATQAAELRQGALNVQTATNAAKAAADAHRAKIQTILGN